MWTWDKASKKLRIECYALALRIWDYYAENAVVMVVLIFLKYNGLCCRFGDSSYLYTEESINTVCVHIMCTIIHVHTICEGLMADHQH